MERKTFIKSGLSLAATATIPSLSNALPPALAREALATKTITWWSWGDPALNPKVTGTVAGHNLPNDAPKVLYERSHPGITIDTTTYNYPDYVVALKTAFAGGSAPDTVQLEPGPLIHLYEPYLLSVEPYAAKLWGPDWRKRYYPAALNQVLSADPTGKTMYGLPMANEVGDALYYNTEIFAKYKLGIPQSYADLKNIADILNSHGVIPIVWGAKDGWPNFDWYRVLVEQTGPSEWVAALTGKGKFTSPGLVKALQILVQMQKDHIFNRGAWGTSAYMEAVTIFGTGKAAMYASGSWDFGTFLPMSAAEKLDVMPIPPMAPGLQRGRLWGHAAVIVAVTKSAKDPAAAFDFVTWYGGPAGQQATWVDRQFFMPTRTDVHPAKMPNARYTKMQQYFLKESPRVVERYGMVSALVQRAIEDAIANVSTLGMDPVKALSAVQAVWDKENKK